MTLEDIHLGEAPRKDGWGAVYRTYTWLAGRVPVVRDAARSYLMPWAVERWRDGAVFRCLGVTWFGRFIPTGGISIRRITGARMAPYTLAGSSLESARRFFFRACAFECAHLPFFVALWVITAIRFSEGRADLAVEDAVINGVVNAYPMMHHRHTRYRILKLLERKQRRGDREAAD